MNDTVAEAEHGHLTGWRAHVHRVVFESATPAGKFFDEIVLSAIVLSVLAVILDSVESIHAVYGDLFYAAEWFFTGLFTVEYIARLVAVRRPTLYARSAFGIIDLIAVLPSYLTIFVPGLQGTVVLRLFRLLRIFRILKLARYVSQGDALLLAMRASKEKIVIFLAFVIFSVIAMGSLMYLVEGPEHGYTSIPVGIYWAVVTLSTVGFGDIVPMTPLGKAIASFTMILGYGFIAVPTGLVTAELLRAKRGVGQKACDDCGNTENDIDARFCKRCGGVI
jgi:voltage-gated potassium channel